MSKASLFLNISDLAGQPIPGSVNIDFEPHNSPAGAGGASLKASAKMGSATSLEVTGIECRGGPGTLYLVRIAANNFRPFAFFQMILEGRQNTASERVLFWAEAGKVRNIRNTPAFEDLPAGMRRTLSTAQMMQTEPEDADLIGKSGPALYASLGPLRKACLLNILTKASHASAGKCFRFIHALLIARQDRFFANVDSGMPEFLRQSDRFTSVNGALHEPLAGLEREDSFKSRDAHANLQVTFMRRVSDGSLAADIDIDESSGIEHGFEVIRNAVLDRRTSPYLIREFMLAADPVERILDPGYRFVF